MNIQLNKITKDKAEKLIHQLFISDLKIDVGDGDITSKSLKFS